MMSPVYPSLTAPTCSWRPRAVAALTAAIIEKDFWVCWTLKRIFTLPDPPAGLLFKGGTSLSKVFGVIERFSEDVDLSFDRAGLGFGGESDPLNATTGKRRKQGLEALTETCQRAIQERLLPQLVAAFGDALGEPPSATWGLELDEDDPAGQTLLFRYPAENRSRAADEPAYIRPVVRLEIGARSDHWPVVEAIVTSYAAEAFPGVFKEAGCKVRVLAAERTFWEKATVLHMWHHAPAEKKFRDRQSRHYYDVVRLYEHELGKAAVRDTDSAAEGRPAQGSVLPGGLGALRGGQAGHAPTRAAGCPPSRVGAGLPQYAGDDLR